MLTVDGNTFLSADESKTSPELEQELFEVSYNGVFKFGFLQSCIGLDIKKFKNKRVVHQSLWVISFGLSRKIGPQ